MSQSVKYKWEQTNWLNDLEIQMEKHVYPSNEGETNFWSQSMKDVIGQDRCKRTEKQNKTFKQKFLRIHTYYCVPRRGSFGECCQARITGNLTLHLSKSPSRGVPRAFHVSPEDLKPSKVFPFPVLSPLLSRFVQSLVVPLPAWGPEGGWVCGSPWSCCQAEPSPCLQGLLLCIALARPAGPANCLQSLDLFTPSPHLTNDHWLTFSSSNPKLYITPTTEFQPIFFLC